MANSFDAVDRELSAVGAAAGARLVELTQDIWGLLTDDIPELRGEKLVEKLLDASVEENVATLLHVFEHGTTPDEVDPPAAAVEYAKRLAQRGVPIVALIRAYRVGHGRFLGRCVEEIAARAMPAELSTAVTARLVEVSFRYIDRVSEQLITIYQRERDRWLLTQTAVRAARVRALLASEPVDIDAAESSLGYRLQQHHLGVIAWVIGDTHGSDGLARLERLASWAGRALGDRRPLFVPRDEALAWIWLPLGKDATRVRALLPDAFDNGDLSARVAVGEPGYGVDGFRRTHLQAARAQDLALAAKPGARLTSFAEVGAVALIWADGPAARSWVWATLADLAIDDEQHARLRDTLQVYLSTGSYTATAERMVLHKNSVQYRVRKAERALGAPIEDRRADLELALRACQYLGKAVLRPVSPE
ncbi:MAG TPA: helix-turn-helix domain-containing protein [Jatrophihabitantaceae bacterium]|nr:helix-turn-helix domain-containing protein [Jatrophihabitantaceae bacterium]